MHSISWIAIATIGLCGALTTPADATPSMTVNKAVIVDGRYAQHGAAQCEGVFFCDITFDHVPAGKTLTVTRVTCGTYVNTTQGMIYVFFKLHDPNQNWVDHLTVIKTGFFDNNHAFTSNDALNHVFKSGQRPVISTAIVETFNRHNIDCTVSGTVE